MKIAMFTNTYLPHVGGVARSIHTLEERCREKGHDVRVIAPEFDGAESSPHVLRVPAIQNFNGSEFSVRLPIPTVIRDFMEEFQPDVIHSHHPFLLGDAALREAWKSRIPIVFTHHTLYERYTHYVPLDSEGLKRAAIQMATGYCNLCDLVIAPSESIAHLLEERKVTCDIEVIPTGIDTGKFASGRSHRYREHLGIPQTAKVIGHVGRLAEEKNLHFLAEAVAGCLEKEPDAVFLLVGEGESREDMFGVLAPYVAQNRVFHPGRQSGDDLTDAYAAIDCFAFSSQSETQGMVLAEAMAARTPVVALDGPGVREILRHGENGLMLKSDATPDEFSQALLWIMQDEDFSKSCAAKAKETAKEYDTECCVNHVIGKYEELVARYAAIEEGERTQWDRMVSGIEIEWDLLVAKMSAAAAVLETPATEEATS
ncbi:MAG: glycosyltransferase family 4 protein [Verrucomicrobiaceae bacterium]|nr:MAG: glycosyltransferase family 4 protein [Verrucomicrobiaceae bacterium]